MSEEREARVRTKPGARAGLYVEALGVSPKHALRELLTEFRQRGWRDPGDAALLVIRRIEQRPGILSALAASAAPPEFFEVNHIRRKDLADALNDLANRR
jgi:hypothetical protein